MSSTKTIQSLDDLYKQLETDEANILQNVVNHERWEYDFESLKEDVNDGEDIKSALPFTLYQKMKSLINGNFIININEDTKENENDINKIKMQTLKEQIHQEIIEQTARKAIIAKIDESEYLFEDIKEDIDDIEESDIISHLKDDHNINDSICKQFCEIVNKLDHIDNIQEINHYEPTKQSLVTQETEDKVHTEQTENDEWDKVFNELRKNTIFNEAIYQIAVNHYRENDYNIETYLDVEEEYDESELKINLFNNELSDDDRHKLYELMIESVKKVKKIKQTTLQRIHCTLNLSPISSPSQFETDKKENINPENDWIFVDDENGKYFQRMKLIKETIEKLHIEQPGDTADTKLDQDKAFIALLCIFGANAVLEMIDLMVIQQAIAYNHNEYDKKRDHLMVTQKEDFKDCFNKFIQNEFHSNNYNKKKFYIYIQGLAVAQITRFLGYGKFSQIATDLSNPNRTETKDESEDDEDDYDILDAEYNDLLKTKSSDDYNIYCCSKSVQMYSLSFIVGVSRYLLDVNDIKSNNSVILDFKIANKSIHEIEEETPRELTYKEFRSKMDHLIGRFCEVFNRKDDITHTFNNKMKTNHIGCWSIDLSKSETEQIYLPYYIGRRKEEIGNEIDDDDYIENYDGVYLFHLMRTKRIFTKKIIEDKTNGDKVTRLGIAVYKFGQSIKLYIIYQGGVIRFQMEDIGKWFKDLFKYHINELNQSNWYIVNKYLNAVLKENKFLATYNDIDDSDIDEYKDKIQHTKTIWEQLTNWKHLDFQFYLKNLNLTQNIAKINKIKPFLTVYRPYLNELETLKASKSTM